ncbi:MAG TPA: copper resistance protein CopC [Candidatus Limnocylindrales bacterium]|nr:copper resistance protein CopC [Candidatus Limnocylindrales bacterium]
MRRVLLAIVLSAMATAVLGISAEAHALVRSSTPADGVQLDRAPARVSITFTESPDARLSIIHVLDSGGRQVERGPAQAVPGDPSTLVVSLPALPNGVYTVSWRTVSAVDGHYAAGAFAFGIGASPGAVPSAAAAPSTPTPDPLGVAGRWVYYVGLALLLGGTWMAALVLRARTPALLRLSAAGIGAALLGLLIAAESQRQVAGATLADFVSTSLAANLVKQLIPILAAALALAIAWRARGRLASWALTAVGVLTLIGIIAHALTTHASASHVALIQLPAQVVHLTAFAVWIGGLAALLVGIRGLEPGLAASAVRRFSFVAGFALAAIGITGLLRAIDEVGTLPRLVSTLFGGLVLVKVALFLVLAILGAINRYRNVAAAEYSLAGLRRVGRGELGVAAVVVAVAAVLTALAPPSYSVASGGSSAPQQITASGSDFGTTVRVTLVAVPGYPGSNRFTVSLRDYDSGQPVAATRVGLRFAFPGRPGVGESTLELARSGSGTYSAQGTNLSLAGRWNATVVVERGLNSAEVPLTLTTAARPEHIAVNAVPGSFTLYTVSLPAGRSVQFYVDPAKAGFNQVHATFFDAKGNELPIADGTVVSGTPDAGPTVDLPVTRLSAGHFVGQGPLAAGRWRFDITATSADSSVYQAYFEETIKP